MNQFDFNEARQQKDSTKVLVLVQRETPVGPKS
jgi:hypothetical protein